jgi:hypothetical protein
MLLCAPTRNEWVRRRKSRSSHDVVAEEGAATSVDPSQIHHYQHAYAGGASSLSPTLPHRELPEELPNHYEH